MQLIIRIDDVHANMSWSRFERFVEGVSQNGLTGILGVIPLCKDPHLLRGVPRAEFWEAMRSLKTKGWTIAQHGYMHVYDSSAPNYLMLPGPSEFAGHSLAEQKRRLAAGRVVLSDQGVETDIFMAPGHTFDTNTLLALREAGFRYVTDGYGLWPYVDHGITLVPQLLSRPHGRLRGVYTTCYHLDQMPEAAIDRAVERLAARKVAVAGFYDVVQDVRSDLIANCARILTAYGLQSLRALRRKISPDRVQ